MRRRTPTTPSIGPIVLDHRPVTSKQLLLLDRDGVVVENRSDYITDLSHVEHLHGAAAAIRHANDLGWGVAFVTNQSAVGRGLLPVDKAVNVHNEIVSHLAGQGAEVTTSAICPHAPVQGCDCRKPGTGMVEAIFERSPGVDREHSWLVGDALTDMSCAAAADVRAVLVRTGRGVDQLRQLTVDPWFAVVSDLREAVDHIASNSPA